jgi:hypothetical protein
MISTNGAVQTQRVAGGVVEVQFARLGVDSEQVIDPRHHARGGRIAGVELGRLKELMSRMRPTASMHHLRPTHMLVGTIAVGLQNAFELSQELLWAVTSRPNWKSNTTPPPGLPYCHK